MASINVGVMGFYHPMAALGDARHFMREASVLIPAAVSIFVCALWLWRRPLPKAVYLTGLVPLVLAAALPLLPKVESGYEQSYWLGDLEYRIPWAYGPYNGRSQPGGSYFLIRVIGPNLKPIYRGSGDHLIVGKATDFDYGRGGAAPETVCASDGTRFRCEWRTGEDVYFFSTYTDNTPADPEALLQPIEDLMDGFAVDAS